MKKAGNRKDMPAKSDKKPKTPPKPKAPPFGGKPIRGIGSP